MKPLLGVNIDHVATLRNVRGTDYPDPIMAAFLAEQAGADSITVHLREDRRHIRDEDVLALRRHVKTRLNLEIAPIEEMIDIACAIRPDTVCLVPERRNEMTTERGLDVFEFQERLTHMIYKLHTENILVSLFIEASSVQIEAAQATAADMIELHTGAYANAEFEEQRDILGELTDAASFAHNAGLIVNAGHGLHYHNVLPIAAIPEIYELNIGHAIVARAVMTGMEEAVGKMKQLIA